MFVSSFTEDIMDDIDELLLTEIADKSLSIVVFKYTTGDDSVMSVFTNPKASLVALSEFDPMFVTV